MAEFTDKIQTPAQSDEPALTKVRRPKYMLDELLVGTNPDIPMTDKERAWHDAPPVGREVW